MFLEFCNCHEVDAPLKVAGMEAPAPPSFHLVCRGFPSTEQSIALLYSPSCPSGGSEIIFLVPLHPPFLSLLGSYEPPENTGVTKPKSDWGGGGAAGGEWREKQGEARRDAAPCYSAGLFL